ncbi:MAG: NADH-quinone oxidoreductase subunit J [Pseudomonadota bacterium]
MTVLSIMFYTLAAGILASTAMAVTRRDPVHAVIYLVVSFFGTALLFYLLGAPLLAAFEVIIYAGAIMVLFLFIVMMMRSDPAAGRLISRPQLVPAVAVSVAYLLVGALALITDPASAAALQPAFARPAMLGFYLFNRHLLSVELASLLLLVALVGAMIIGGPGNSGGQASNEDIP